MPTTKSKRPHTRQEKLAFLLAAVWVLATGWLFLFSAVAEPPLPPPQVARILIAARMNSLPGWAMTLIPLWCLWLDCQFYGTLPTLTGWLRRYLVIIVASLGTAFWIFSQRDYPEGVAQEKLLFYILLWTLYYVLCLCRKPAE